MQEEELGERTLPLTLWLFCFVFFLQSTAFSRQLPDYFFVFFFKGMSRAASVDPKHSELHLESSQHVNGRSDCTEGLEGVF